MRALAVAPLAVALLALSALAGCGGKPAPVTGLVVAIDYSGDVARIDVSGAAETTGRQFGPWSLTADQLTSGGTVGFIFDAADAGTAMVCAQTFDRDGNDRDFDCGTYDLVADSVTDGTLAMDGSDGGDGGDFSARDRLPRSPSASAAADSPARSRR
jgi:hypothetical protein